MTWFSVIGCALFGFGPTAAVGGLVVARRSHLSIIAVIAAFAWLLATTFAALLWICIPPLKNSNWWIVLSGVSIHEIVRYIFVHLYYRTDEILRQANERVPFTDESSALAAGVAGLRPRRPRVARPRLPRLGPTDLD